MKGDFSRIRFNPSRQYTAVLEQQGRVSLDADDNEQAAITDYLDRTETVDVIGAFGAPEHNAGFAISISGNEILIGAGRYYVEGLMCENNTDNLPYLGQTYLLNPSASDATLLSELAQAGGSSAIQVYLQVWQRLVTALDDPCLREPALGQADTTGRLQTVSRVVASLVPPSARPTRPVGKLPTRTIFGATLLQTRQNLAELLKLRALTESTIAAPVLGPVSLNPPPSTPNPPSSTPAAVDCCTAMYETVPTVSTGRMRAATATAGSDCSCQPIPAAGYQGLENQLYRVEIHRAGTETTATFKWSRENGSVVTAIQSVNGNTVVLDSLGPDANLGFAANDWVEISDDTDLFGDTPNGPGLLYQVQSTDPTIPSLTLTTPVVGVTPSRNARVRRWDQAGPTASSSGVPISPGTQLPLENGIQVTFRAGNYQAGDYWTIPARTASGQIDWPPCASNGDLFQPPESSTVYNAPLACIHWDGRLQQFAVEDCRRLFSPLTELSAPSASKALHVKAINWANDSLITADVWVSKGLAVTFDAPPTSPLTSAEFAVSVETIFNPFQPFVSNRAFNPQLPSTYIRTCSTLDSTITVNGATVSWTVPYLKAPQLQVLTVNAINASLLFGAELGQHARVRVRLLGNAITSGAGPNQLYLDGRALGQPTQDPTGTTRMDLQLPSGAGVQSSDFESWFYVAPTLLIANLLVANTALFTLLGANNNVIGVSNTPPNPPTGATGPKVDPFATVMTNYRALADAQLTLSLVDATGAPSTLASIESPVTIHAGEVSVNAAIAVTGNPLNSGVATTVTLTLHASIATAVGAISFAGSPVTFTLTGTTPRQIIG
jgi:hypothetical protein